MGGQDEYRKIYIAHPERFFVNVYSVVYVIDVQDKSNYKLSLSYLEKIMTILESFGEFADFIIFLHKADPQIYDKIQNVMVQIEGEIEEIFKKYNFVHRIYHTSIFNTILTESNIFESLSNLFELSNQKETSPALLNTIQLVKSGEILRRVAVE